ncbi:hypothetical protein ACVBEF_16115 [Glaciimonas sp. GG7]
MATIAARTSQVPQFTWHRYLSESGIPTSVMVAGDMAGTVGTVEAEVGVDMVVDGIIEQSILPLVI